jgi:hypothetical protein
MAGTVTTPSPLALELASLRGLLIIDLADDPTYKTLEPQLLDGPDGIGLTLLAYRHDGRVELYAEEHLQIDPSGYDGLEQGLAGIQRTAFDPARFELTDDGLKLDITLSADNGRRFELHLHEHLKGGRDTFTLLAPVGGSFTAPTFFPFLWLPTISFVPVRNTDVTLLVDGEPRTVTRLPLPLGGRRCLMARYDLDAMVCQLNPTWATDPPQALVDRTEASTPDEREVVDIDGQPALAGLHVRRGTHRCAVRFDPPLPDPATVPTDTHLHGSVPFQANGATQLQGRYELERTGERVTLVIDQISPWRPRQRRPLLAVLFRLPTFRHWPTTYRWEAELDLTASTGSPWTSRWTRPNDRQAMAPALLTVQTPAMETSRHVRRWKDLSSSQQRTVIAVGAITTIWQIAMLWDLARRPADQIRGTKRAWVLASFVRPFGQIAYDAWGRRR